MCELLGRASRRGLHWQALGVFLLLTGEPPAPEVLRTCLTWVINALDVPHEQPGESTEARVERERINEGKYFRAYANLAKQAAVPAGVTREETVYALIQNRFGEATGPEEAAAVKRALNGWLASVGGSDFPIPLFPFVPSPKTLRRYREILASTEDLELEAAVYLSFVELEAAFQDADEQTMDHLARTYFNVFTITTDLLELIAECRTTRTSPSGRLGNLDDSVPPDLAAWAQDKLAQLMARPSPAPA